jgi:hypothetical protein
MRLNTYIKSKVITMNVSCFMSFKNSELLFYDYRRREDGIRIDVREAGRRIVKWIQLAQDRDRWCALVNTVMNLRVLASRT